MADREKHIPVHNYTVHPPSMTGVGGSVLLRVHVPHPDSSVHATRIDAALCYCKADHATAVSRQGSNTRWHRRTDIPQLDGFVTRPADQFVRLYRNGHRRNAIFVTM